jgi:hypothetical protein
MSGHYEIAYYRLALTGGTVQILIRQGYAASPPPAPKETLQAKLFGA